MYTQIHAPKAILFVMFSKAQRYQMLFLLKRERERDVKGQKTKIIK